LKYTHRGKKSSSELLATGRTPNKAALNDAKSTLIYQTHERQFGQLLSYQGYPGDRLVAATNFNGDFDNNFYCIFPVVDPGSGYGKIRIGADVKCWDYVFKRVNNPTPRWDSNTGNIGTLQVNVSTNQRDDVTAPPNGVRFYDFYEVDYNKNQVGDYGYTKLSFEALNVATCNMFVDPIRFSTIDALDPNWGAQQFYINDDAFNINQALRGCDRLDDQNGSIGELCERGGAQNDNVPNQVDSSARCLFQWGHPAGNYIVGTTSTATYKNIFGAGTQIVDARELKTNNKKADVLIVGTWDNNTKFRVANSSGTGTPSASTILTPAASTPTMIKIGEIDIQNGGDSLTFEAEVSDTAAVQVNSVAVFEKHNQY
jgi:hypothetical protein